MANSNFRTQTGLTVGSLTIDAASGNLTTSGSLTANSFIGHDSFVNKTSATGVVTHDCSETTLFRHSSISANFTANLTNLGLSSGYAGGVTLLLVQGSTGYYYR